MAYQDMQTEDNLASQEYYDSLEGQGSVPMGNTSTGGTNKRALYATDENGMKYKAGDVADFGDDDYSWHDGDDIDLMPGGLDKASIEQQLREISAKDQTEYLDAIAGGDFTANSQFSEYQQQKMRDSKNEEADRVLRELQEKSKYLEETGQSRPLVK